MYLFTLYLSNQLLTPKYMYLFTLYLSNQLLTPKYMYLFTLYSLNQLHFLYTLRRKPVTLFGPYCLLFTVHYTVQKLTVCLFQKSTSEKKLGVTSWSTSSFNFFFGSTFLEKGQKVKRHTVYFSNSIVFEQYTVWTEKCNWFSFYDTCT